MDRSTRQPRRTGLAGVALALLVASTGLPSQGASQVQPQGAPGAARQLALSTGVAAAREAFVAGQTAIENVFPSRARRMFAESARLDPSFGLARVMAAGLATGMTPQERAAEMTRGVADAANQTPGELLLAMAYRELYSGRGRIAAALFKTASEMMPDDPHVAFRAAQSAPVAERGAAMRAVIARFPDFSPTYNSLAYIQLAAGDQAGALATAEEQLRRAPKEPNAHDSMAELLDAAGRRDEAIKHYTHAVELAPDYTAGHIALAMIEAKGGRFDQSRARLATALANAPAAMDSATVMLAIAGSHVAEGKSREAMSQIESVARLAEGRKLNSLAGEAYRSLASLDAMYGSGRSIASHIDRAAKLDTSSYARQYVTALAYAAAGQEPQAGQAIQALTALGDAGNETAKSDARVARGALLLKQKKAAEAIEELQRADTANVYALSLLAEAQRLAGRAAEAQATREKVLARAGRDLSDLGTALALRHAGKR